MYGFRKPRAKEELPVVDKVVWYVQKLAMSVGELKASPTEENLQRTLKTIQQIKERLGVDTSILERALADYARLVRGDRKEREDEVEARMEVNMALKSVLILSTPCNGFRQKTRGGRREAGRGTFNSM